MKKVSSKEYMTKFDYLALYQQARICRSGSLREQAESKRIAARSKSYMLLMTAETARLFYKEYPQLWVTDEDDEMGIGWSSTANVTQVFEACQKLGIVAVPLNIDHKDIPKDSHGTRAEWLEKTACEKMTLWTGEKFHWTATVTKRGYRPDGTSSNGKTLEVKGASSVMTCSSATKVHQR
jgi:hypothetical protein